MRLSIPAATIVGCRSRGCLALALVVAGVTGAAGYPSASAQAVHARIESCPHVDEQELVRLLRVELGERLQGEPQAPLQLHLRCDAHRDGVEVRLVAMRGTAQRARRLPARATAGEVGARVVALAMIELLRELEARDPPTRPPAPVPAPRETASLPGPLDRGVRLALAAQALWPRAQAPLLGAVLSVELAPYGRWLLLRLDAGLAGSERSVGLAAVRSRLVHAAPQVGVLQRGHGWQGRATLGYRLGQARIAGDSGGSTRPAAVHGALWGGPLLAAGAGLALYGPLSVEIGAELGLVVHSVTGVVAGASSDVDLDAFWYAGWLGLSYAP